MPKEIDESTKFKVDPYNPTNKFITENDIINIMNTLNITDFKITNLNFYKTAFTHKSYCKLKEYEEFENKGNSLPLQDNSYETMEFLGDAILGSIVSSYLYERFYKIHGQNEGFLTKLKIRIICGENLSQLSKHLSFNKYIILSKHVDDNCSGRENENILEDVFEAFLGAIYLDNDYKVIEKFIIHVIEKYVDFTKFLLIDNNYKDQITRYFQKNYNDGIRPIYKHTKKDNIFYCDLYYKDKVLISGEGMSKKKSEQDVSKKALIYFHVLT